ncbi:hypothetical protein [Pseudanabaena galeata]|uniref:hypothetical protein n=1 Tax=Pseudanabaena galeata TaxID=1112103 RepID=UPI00247A06E7|nr:hypothetical protein [Pseudanabaena galeata]WGS75343.1 hypothetical protein OA858_25665 [Pseudanabaena galeata CCNP1313]
MTLPIPVIGQLIDSVGNVVNSGFGILGDLVRGHMDRQERKFALEELKIKADEARKNLELEVNLDIKTREANLRILQGMMDIVQDVIRTDLELKLLAQRGYVELQLIIMNWQKSITVDLVELKQEILTDMKNDLVESESLHELIRDRFISDVYEKYHECKKMIADSNSLARQLAESLANSFKPIDPKLQETLDRLAGMDTLKLLNEYPEDGDQ